MSILCPDFSNVKEMLRLKKEQRERELYVTNYVKEHSEKYKALYKLNCDYMAKLLCLGGYKSDLGYAFFSSRRNRNSFDRLDVLRNIALYNFGRVESVARYIHIVPVYVKEYNELVNRILCSSRNSHLTLADGISEDEFYSRESKLLNARVFFDDDVNDRAVLRFHKHIYDPRKYKNDWWLKYEGKCSIDFCAEIEVYSYSLSELDAVIDWARQHDVLVDMHTVLTNKIHGLFHGGHSCCVCGENSDNVHLRYLTPISSYSFTDNSLRVGNNDAFTDYLCNDCASIWQRYCGFLINNYNLTCYRNDVLAEAFDKFSCLFPEGRYVDPYGLDKLMVFDNFKECMKSYCLDQKLHGYVRYDTGC